MKININKIMDEIVSLQNQITGLQMLLDQKKSVMAKYFDKTGNRSVSNDDCTISVQERTTVDYDIEALSEKLPRNILPLVVEKHFEINDWDAFSKFLKRKGISGQEVRPYISITKNVNKDSLSKLYDQKKLSIKDIQGCYTAKVTKSVVLRLKDAKREINIT